MEEELPKPPFLTSLRVGGLLSFAPDSGVVEFSPLTVLVGPNGSGKTNLMEAISLLAALPADVASFLRAGGGFEEWLWKGSPDGLPGGRGRWGHASWSGQAAELQAAFHFDGGTLAPGAEDWTYSCSLAATTPGAAFVREELRRAEEIVFCVEGGTVTLRERDRGDPRARREEALERHFLERDQSILRQRKFPETYPQLTSLARALERTGEHREWLFGRLAPARRGARTDLPTDRLLQDASNLALLAQEADHQGYLDEVTSLLRGVLPRARRLSVRPSGGQSLLYLHEEGVAAPVSATRLSDGTLRFLALALALLDPTPPPIVLIEEPELGLHPDALRVVAKLLERASSRTQLVVTTHSASLLSALEDPACVRVCVYEDGTKVQRLDVDELQEWLDEYTLGDLWRIGKLGGNLDP